HRPVLLRVEEEPGERATDGVSPVPGCRGRHHGPAADDLPPHPASGLRRDRQPPRQSPFRARAAVPTGLTPAPRAASPTPPAEPHAISATPPRSLSTPLWFFASFLAVVPPRMASSRRPHATSGCARAPVTPLERAPGRAQSGRSRSTP